MVNILLGNTFRVSWRVLTNNEALSFKDRDISLILAAPSGKPMSVTPTVSPEDEDGATLSFVFQGSAQKEAGVYRLIIVENKAKESQALTDEIMAFRLVENRSDVTPDIPEFGGMIQADVDTGNLKVGWRGDSAYESWLRVIKPESGADGEDDFIAWLRQPAEDAWKVFEANLLPITTENIADAAITSVKIAAGAVSSDNIGNNAVTRDKLAAGANNPIVVPFSTSAATLNADAYNALMAASWNVLPDCIVTYNNKKLFRLSKYSDNSLADLDFGDELQYVRVSFGQSQRYYTCQLISSDAVYLKKSGGAMTGALTVLEPANDSNPATKKYVDSALEGKFPIKTGDIADAAVTTAKIADSAVQAAKLASDSVTTDKIADESVTNDKIGANAVTTGKIADAAVTESKIGTGAVTNDKIGADAVTTAKLADESVTTDKIGAGAVTSSKIAVGGRNPIILTDSTTEVDEDTFQKLLRADVDVVYQLGDGSVVNPQVIDTSIEEHLTLLFSYNFVTTSSSEGEITENALIVANLQVLISRASPHKVVFSPAEWSMDTTSVVYKPSLASLLQQIDLTGTKEERKAKLDQFGKDWTALTGTEYPDGARFIGYLRDEDNNEVWGLMVYDGASDGYRSFCTNDGGHPLLAWVSAYTGSIGFTPLSLLHEVTYSELKALRDGKRLVPGAQYRITDYVTTTAQSGTQSAGHPFDVIVTADDEGTLNENARAVLNSGDTYFKNCDLNAWQLKYCLDNDTTRFAWATSSGKGVIYRMIDEWNNDLPYDFKNIQFLVAEVASDDPIRAAWDAHTAGDVWYRAVSGNSKWTKKTGNTIYAYTFNKATITDDVLTLVDASVLGTSENPYDNSIKPRYSSAKQYLNEIVWMPYVSTQAITVCGNHFGENNYKSCLTTYNAYGCKTGINCYNFNCGDSCYSWTCGNNCYSWTCGNLCYSWTCGNECHSWTCGNRCDAWKTGHYCDSWTCGNDCNAWICGNYCYSWTCGNTCAFWKTGNDCYGWTCGNNCYSWTCGNSCRSWKTGDYCYSWTCGNSCRSWKTGDYCYYWTCGNYCDSWTCGNGCQNWTCGNYCYGWSCGYSSRSWSCGNFCYTWTCGNYCSSWKTGDYCYYWTCGNYCDSWTCGNYCFFWVTGSWSGSAKNVENYVQYFTLASGTSYVGIKSSGTPTSSSPLKNFVVKSGIAGTSSSPLNIVIDAADFPLNSNYEWIIAKNSKGEIKQYCEADLIN